MNAKSNLTNDSALGPTASCVPSAGWLEQRETSKRPNVSETPTKITLTVPRVPLSPNKLLGRHWRRKHQEKQTWMLEIRAAWGGPIKKNETQRMRVTVVISNSRVYDKDNRYGACKIIFDAMKELGIIVDDREEWLDQNVFMLPCARGQGRTTIELEPLVNKEVCRKARGIAEPGNTCLTTPGTCESCPDWGKK